MILKKSLKLKIKRNLNEKKILKMPAGNSRYKIFGHLAELKDGFVLGKFVHNGKNSHL